MRRDALLESRQGGLRGGLSAFSLSRIRNDRLDEVYSDKFLARWN
jgi:hypothetical protein